MKNDDLEKLEITSMRKSYGDALVQIGTSNKDIVVVEADVSSSTMTSIFAEKPALFPSVINAVFKVAGYTYGPLLGLFSSVLSTKYKIKDKLVPLVAVLSPVLTFVISYFSEDFLWGYKFGFELLILNGLITFIGLLIIKKKLN